MANKIEEAPEFILDDGTTVQYVDGIKFPCPSCGLEVMSGAEEDGRQSIIHKQPMCHEFESMDPLAFLTYARKYYEKGGN